LLANVILVGAWLLPVTQEYPWVKESLKNQNSAIVFKNEL
jgi:hypothetical protein